MWKVVGPTPISQHNPNDFTVGTGRKFWCDPGTWIWEITGGRSRLHKINRLFQRNYRVYPKTPKRIKKHQKIPTCVTGWSWKTLGFLLTDLCPKNLPNMVVTSLQLQLEHVPRILLHSRVVISWTFHACQGIKNLSLSMTVPTPDFIINSMILIAPPIITCNCVCIWNGVFRGVPCTKSFRPPSEDDDDNDSPTLIMPHSPYY